MIDSILIYSHYFIVFGLFAQFFMALWHIKENSRGFVLYLFTQLFAVILFLPWLPFLLANAGGGAWMPAYSFAKARRVYNEVIGTGTSSISYVLIGVILVVLITNCIRSYNHVKKWDKSIIPVFIATFPVAGVSIVSIVHDPFFVTRYMMYLLPGAIFFIAYHLSIFRVHFLIKTTIFLFVLKLTTTTLNLSPTNDGQVRNVITMLNNELAQPNTVLVISAGYQMSNFLYYHDKESFSKLSEKEIANEYKKDKIILIGKPADIHKIDTLNWRKIVYLELHRVYVDPQNEVFHYLNSIATLNQIFSEQGLTISIFTNHATLWTDTTENVSIYTSFEENNLYHNNITRKIAKTGYYSAYANETYAYSDGIRGKIGKLHNKNGTIRAKAWIYLQKDTKAKFVISFHKTNGEIYLHKSIPADYKKYNQWQLVDIEFPIPQTYSELDEMYVYLNVHEGKEAYIDDIKISTNIK